MTADTGMRMSSPQDEEALSSRQHWMQHYRCVRRQSEALCAPLETEDYVIQTMPNVSPPKWHLAHVTWFFETFLLIPYLPAYHAFQPQFAYLFNSYYETVGTPYPRSQRGLLARPTVEEVYRYRAYVDAAMDELIASAGEDVWAQIAGQLELGIQHEQQHQELLLTDIKHIFAHNPLCPAYHKELKAVPLAHRQTLDWMAYERGVREVGQIGSGFCFDNETPAHHVLMQDFQLANRLVTCGEYLEFIEDGGYRRPEFWLADGWRTVQENDWQAPLYWEKQENGWSIMTLSGMRALQDDEPVCHVSYYEADAYARWTGQRLATEMELETALRCVPVEGNFVESGLFHPRPAQASPSHQLYGDVWEWTQSAYSPYPGYRPAAGALGEYNGKFMCNQFVLRGGSCATPMSHIRASYRNFFAPGDRWQFTGIRLARN